jgi:putative ABC transport system permease protein
MIENYLKIAIRNITKYKGYSLINIFGLIIGMTCCLLILLWVQHEVSYDSFHSNVDRIYRIGVDGYLGRSFRLPISSIPTGPAIIEQYPEIESYTRLTRPQDVTLKYEEEEIFDIQMSSADSTFFKIFSYPLLIGNTRTILTNPNTIVISEKLSNQLFFESDPIGKVVIINGYQEYEITGVFKELPENTHLDFDALGSFETLYINDEISNERWLPFGVFTYLLLSPNINTRALEDKMITVIKGTQLESILENTGGSLKFFLQPLNDIHLHSHLEAEFTVNGNITTVYIFSIIAIVILLMGCFNYINLSTALWSIRVKEIGLRKTLGASRKNLILQFLFESVIHCLIALFFSIVLITIIESEVNTFASISVDFNLFKIPWLIPLLILFSIVIGILGGFYPAFFISSYNPVNILKGLIFSGRNNSSFRNILIIVQFICSISLLIGTIVIYSQMRYVRTKDLGFKKDLIVYIPNLSEDIINKKTLIKDKLLTASGTKSITFSSSIPGVRYMKGLFHPEGFNEEESQSMDMLSVDSDYMTTLGISLIEGRNFDRNISSDSSEAVIINETAMRKFGWTDPIGKYFSFNTEEPGVQAKMYVIGVVKDFHITSVRENIEPLFIEYKPRLFNTISIKVVANNLPETFGQLKNIWEEILPTQPFNNRFLDATYDNMYHSEVSLSKIILYFSILAVLLGCLGLFGISMFLIDKRTKEIGIRKVHGASISHVVILLSKNYTMLIIIAFFIASSISWYVMNRWLERFAYKINVEWWYFALAGLLALFIAWLTVSYQSIKVARINPIESLRYE